MADPTEKCRAFMEHNRRHKVVSAACLPRDAPPDAITKTRYRFTDGSTRVLSVADARSAPADWFPAWDHG